MPDRFDPDLLDPDDPFEMDMGNLPHLHKHLPTERGRQIVVGPEDLLDVFLFGRPLFYPADPAGEADWLMVGELPGLVVSVPLAAPNRADVSKCRPIGIYKASASLKDRYRNDA